MKKPMYIEETEIYLKTDVTYKQLAKRFGVSSTTMSNRVCKTISRIVEYFDFNKRGIDYPYDDIEQGSAYWNFRNAKKYSDFWLKIIDDYKKGVKCHNYNAPNALLDARLISSLTVSELREIIRSELNPS